MNLLLGSADDDVHDATTMTTTLFTGSRDEVFAHLQRNMAPRHFSSNEYTERNKIKDASDKWSGDRDDIFPLLHTLSKLKVLNKRLGKVKSKELKLVHREEDEEAEEDEKDEKDDKDLENYDKNKNDESSSSSSSSSSSPFCTSTKAFHQTTYNLKHEKATKKLHHHFQRLCKGFLKSATNIEEETEKLWERIHDYFDYAASSSSPSSSISSSISSSFVNARGVKTPQQTIAVALAESMTTLGRVVVLYPSSSRFDYVEYVISQATPFYQLTFQWVFVSTRAAKKTNKANNTTNIADIITVASPTLVNGIWVCEVGYGRTANYNGLSAIQKQEIDTQIKVMLSEKIRFVPYDNRRHTDLQTILRRSSGTVFVIEDFPRFATLATFDKVVGKLDLQVSVSNDERARAHMAFNVMETLFAHMSLHVASKTVMIYSEKMTPHEIALGTAIAARGSLEGDGQKPNWRIWMPLGKMFVDSYFFADSQKKGKMKNEQDFLQRMGLIYVNDDDDDDDDKDNHVFEQREVVVTASEYQFERHQEIAKGIVKGDDGIYKQFLRSSDFGQISAKMEQRQCCHLALPRNISFDDMLQDHEKYIGKQNAIKYAPKLVSILKNILENDEKKQIVQSQFRTFGIAVLQILLEENGYRQFAVVKKENSDELDIEISETISISSSSFSSSSFSSSSSSSSSKFYCLYTGQEDSEEKRITRLIFNGDWKDDWKFYGKLQRMFGGRKDQLKVLLMTSSGAHGPEIKGVDIVHVMEPNFDSRNRDALLNRLRNNKIENNKSKKIVVTYRLVFDQKKDDDDDKKQFDDDDNEDESGDDYVNRMRKITEATEDFIFKKMFRTQGSPNHRVSNTPCHRLRVDDE